MAKLPWQIELLLPGFLILLFLLVIIVLVAATGTTLFSHTFPPVPTKP